MLLTIFYFHWLSIINLWGLSLIFQRNLQWLTLFFLLRLLSLFDFLMYMWLLFNAPNNILFYLLVNDKSMRDFTNFSEEFGVVDSILSIQFVVIVWFSNALVASNVSFLSLLRLLSSFDLLIYLWLLIVTFISKVSPYLL